MSPAGHKLCIISECLLYKQSINSVMYSHVSQLWDTINSLNFHLMYYLPIPLKVRLRSFGTDLVKL